jgi:hypothetical protein
MISIRDSAEIRNNQLPGPAPGPQTIACPDFATLPGHAGIEDWTVQRATARIREYADLAMQLFTAAGGHSGAMSVVPSSSRP